MYYQFNSFQSEIDALKESGAEIPRPKNPNMYNTAGLLRVSGLSRQVQELMSDYLVIEEYYLRRTIEKVT